MRAELTIRCDMTTDLVQSMGNDVSILQAMLVSTKGEGVFTEDVAGSEKAAFGRLNFLMRNRHGTPFECGAMTFYIEAPVFVFREFHRHRVGWSYSEVSARYRQLSPTFYVPGSDRPLIQVGKPGAYVFEQARGDEIIYAAKKLCESYSLAYRNYEDMLDYGIAKEVARACLPVATYSAMFATCNPRSLMHFLGLRTKHELAKFPSFPQHEIELVAHGMEAHFASLFPLTWKAFNENGRIAP